MRSIGVLDFVRKKKRVFRRVRLASPCLLAALVMSFSPFAVAAESGNVVMQTPSSSGAVIGKDPETGTRVMRTPEPKEQESYQGPQTVIVAPEVYPDISGNRPSNNRSPKPQSR